MTTRIAPLPVDAGDGRTLEVLVVRWNTPARVTDDGRSWYSETFARGGLTLPADRRRPVLVRAEHTGAVIGRVDSLRDSDDGPVATVRIADTAAGRDTLALVADGVVNAVSAEFLDDTPVAPGGTVTRTRAVLDGLALTIAPQHADAVVLARRSDPPITPQEHPMPDLDPTLDPTPDDVEQLDDDQAADDTPPAAEDRTPALTRSAPTPRRPARPDTPTPAARWRSLGDAIHNASTDPHAALFVARHLRAWTDQLASDTPGLMPHTYTRRVVSIMGSTAPTLSLFSSAPLPADGEFMHLGVVKQVPDFGKVPTEKTDLPSRKMLVEDLPVRIELYGGGFDLGWFAWRRSSPSVIDQALTEWTKVAAIELEQAATALLLAEADAYATVTIDAADPAAGFVTAAKHLLTGTYRFPEVCVLGVDLWETLANAKGADDRPLFPHLNPSNPVGRASITDDTGEVRGLTFAVSPAMDPTAGIVGVREAFISAAGPRTTLAVDVPRLAGRDVAVLMEAAMSVTDNRGLVKLAAPAGP